MFNLNQSIMKKFFGLMLLCATMMGIVSCETSDNQGITLSQTNYSMYSDANTTIEGSGLTNAVWKSNDEFVASANGNQLTSFKIGSTYLSCNGQKINVKVMPRFTSFKEPDMSWGSSKNSIIAQNGTPYSNQEDAIVYKTDNPNSPLIVYMFEGAKLAACGMVVPFSAGSNLVDFLDERYVFYSVNTSTYTANFAHCYGTKDAPIIDYAGQMAFDSSLDAIMVLYIGSNTTKSVDSNTIFNSMIETIKNNI